jgi:hypothetical protein
VNKITLIYFADWVVISWTKVTTIVIDKKALKIIKGLIKYWLGSKTSNFMKRATKKLENKIEQNIRINCLFILKKTSLIKKAANVFEINRKKISNIAKPL